MTHVSIVTVVLNDLPGLLQTAKSLASQTNTDVEWIVIDGASTGAHRIEKHSLTPSPTTFVSEPDAGIYDAMNKGWKNASGEWVLFLNAGDTLCQGRTLEDVVPQLEASPASWAFGMVRMLTAAETSSESKTPAPSTAWGTRWATPPFLTKRHSCARTFLKDLADSIRTSGQQQIKS